jgi:outer membrane cobalamin receptor
MKTLLLKGFQPGRESIGGSAVEDFLRFVSQTNSYELMIGDVLRHQGKWVRRTGALALVFLLGIFCVPASAWAQDTGTITGTVVDQNGEPLPGAQIVVVGTMKGSTTDAGGQYTIQNAPAGQIDVRAKFVGYKPQTQSIDLGAGETATIDFTLATDQLGMEEVVVTGSFSERSKMESSVAITTLNSAKIEDQNAQSISDLMKAVPGMWVESSGGQGGNNVFTRGLPSAGKLTFVELNYNGLPVLEGNDLDFGNTDQFFRSDKSIQTMESVRGGTASIFAASAPAGIMNFRSKTGGQELGGTVKIEAGTVAETRPGRLRTDFNIGGPMGEDWRFNVGGFYRFDEGVRNPGFTANRGGQITGNVTRLLDNGYVRAYGRYMNDQTAFFLPVPLQNPDDPEGIDGLDANYGTMTGLDASTVRVPGPNATPGNPNFVTRDLTEGIHPEVRSFQLDFLLDITDRLSLENKAKVMRTDMTFNAAFSLGSLPLVGATEFPTTVAEGSDVINGVSDFTYTFASSGEPVNNLSTLNGNGLVSQVGWWHVENDLSGFIEELELTYDTEAHSVTGGFYFSRYARDETWHWNNMLLEVTDNPRMLDLTLTDNSGQMYQVTQNGFTQYGTVHNKGSGNATILAGYVGDEFQATEKLRIDVGARLEKSVFRGRAGGSRVLGTEDDTPPDVPVPNPVPGGIDGDETTLYDDGVSVSDNSFQTYNHSETEWALSGGLNYSISDRYAVFGRFSRGFHMPDLDAFRSGPADPPVTEVLQGELGFKANTPNFGLFATLFWSQLLDQTFTDRSGPGNAEVTKTRDTETPGIELEFNGQYNDFTGSITATLQNPTYGDQTLVLPSGEAIDLDDNRIPRQPRYLVSVNPRYDLGLAEVSTTLRFVDSRFTTDANNALELPAYYEWNASVSTTQGPVTVKLTGANLTNSIGLTEGNPRTGTISGGGPTQGIFQARPILGRRFNLSLQYDF